MDRQEFIDFLLFSDFLQQHGYKIVGNNEKSYDDVDIDVEGV